MFVSDLFATAYLSNDGTVCLPLFQARVGSVPGLIVGAVGAVVGETTYAFAGLATRCLAVFRSPFEAAIVSTDMSFINLAMFVTTLLLQIWDVLRSRSALQNKWIDCLSTLTAVV